MTSATDHSQARGQFFELAQPDLYRRNAFRVLGLGVETSTRDVRNRQKQLRRRERLGIDGDHRQGTILPLDPPPDESQLQDALQRLQDPVTRLLDEFFWFWPLGTNPDETDPALELLKQHRNQDALKHWQECETKQPNNFTVTHNLAVLYHLWALDLELKSRGQKLTEVEQKTRLACWDRSYQRWRKLVKTPECWQYVRGRIGELDDPRLDRAFAEGVRDSLAEVMLLIHARLTVSAAEKEAAEHSQHLDTMLKSGLDSPLIDDALRTALAPTRERIRSLAAAAEPKADADPPHADEVAKQLLSETQPLLQVLGRLLPADDRLRQTAHDEVARTALRCQIAYGNKTEDWATSKALLTQSLSQLSPGEAMRQRLQENLEIVAKNLRGSQCFFCSERTPVESAGIVVSLYGDVEREFTGFETFRVTWQKVDVKVPRCATCQTIHDDSEEAQMSWAAGAWLGSGALLMIAAWLFAPSDATGFYWFAAACIVLVLSLAVGGGAGLAAVERSLASAPYRPRPLEDQNEHPTVQEHTNKGYSFGTEPSEDEQQSARLKSSGGGRDKLVDLALALLKASGHVGGGGKPAAESCPICGVSFGWDGEECSNCGHGGWGW